MENIRQSTHNQKKSERYVFGTHKKIVSMEIYEYYWES